MLFMETGSRIFLRPVAFGVSGILIVSAVLTMYEVNPFRLSQGENFKMGIQSMNPHRHSQNKTLSELKKQADESPNKVITHKGIAYGIPETREYLIPVSRFEPLLSILPENYFGKDSVEIGILLQEHWSSSEVRAVTLFREHLKGYRPISFTLHGQRVQIRLAKIANDNDTILKSVTMDIPKPPSPETLQFFGKSGTASESPIFEFLRVYGGFSPESPRVAEFSSSSDSDHILDKEFYPNIESFHNFPTWEDSIIVCMGPNHDFLVMNSKEQFAWMVFETARFEKVSETFDEIILKYLLYFEHGEAFDSFNYFDQVK